MKAQTRMASLRESWTNIVVGFGIQWVANYFVLPLFGLHPSIPDLFKMGAIFTLISVARQYVLRRFYERKRAADVPPDFQYIIEEVAAERHRQISGEAYSLDHDDSLIPGDLARGAAAYALSGAIQEPLSRLRMREWTASVWPWDRNLFRPTQPRRDLIKAAAMLIAEIGRFDRAARRRHGGATISMTDVR